MAADPLPDVGPGRPAPRRASGPGRYGTGKEAGIETAATSRVGDGARPATVVPVPDLPPAADTAPPSALDGDAVDPVEVEAAPRPRRGEGVEARRVRRIVRTVDVWSVLKVAFLFTVCLWLILLVAGVIVWSVASSTGTVGNVESFLADLLAEETFTIDGGQVFQAVLVGGLILVFAGTGFAGLLTVLFNLISELTGGIRLSVVEVEHTRRPRRRGRRAPPAGVDGSDGERPLAG